MLLISSHERTENTLLFSERVFCCCTGGGGGAEVDVDAASVANVLARFLDSAALRAVHAQRLAMADI